MQISARNQLPGRVSALVPGPVNAEVTLALAGGDSLVAVVTQGSVAALGLVVGGPVTAIVKAPWVTLMVGGSSAGLAAGNQLAGVVHSIMPGAINAEVALQLAGGTVVHAVVTHAAVLEMGLAPGVPARAVVPAAQVVLAVP